MTPLKRVLDVFLAGIFIAILALPLLIIATILFLAQGRPVFYLSERMNGPDSAFQLWKFRTMTVVASDSGVSGGDKSKRITPVGRFLRKVRLDELPQLWNILRGDMSFVGPRPPLRAYVAQFPAIYADVLKSRPGLTGLATLYFHHHEARLLAVCQTPEHSDAVYRRRCVARKARLDLIYQRRRSIWFDMVLIVRTVVRVLRNSHSCLTADSHARD